MKLTPPAWWPLARLAKSLERLSALPPLTARLAAGWVFLESGTGKLQNLSDVADFFRQWHFSHPVPLAVLVASIEAVGGACLLAGLATRLICLPLQMILITALLTVRRPEIEGFADLFSAPEFLFALLLAWLLISGPGPLSLDHWLFRRWKRQG